MSCEVVKVPVSDVVFGVGGRDASLHNGEWRVEPADDTFSVAACFCCCTCSARPGCSFCSACPRVGDIEPGGAVLDRRRTHGTPLTLWIATGVAICDELSIISAVRGVGHDRLGDVARRCGLPGVSRDGVNWKHVRNAGSVVFVLIVHLTLPAAWDCSLGRLSPCTTVFRRSINDTLGLRSFSNMTL